MPMSYLRIKAAKLIHEKTYKKEPKLNQGIAMLKIGAEARDTWL